MVKHVEQKMKGTIVGMMEAGFGEADQLREELQEWYDNLPESFQNGSKGEALQEAINYLEGNTDVPDAPEVCERWEFEYVQRRYKKRQSRAARLSNAINDVQKGIEECDALVARLDALPFTSDGRLIRGGVRVDDTELDDHRARFPNDPPTEDERSAMVEDVEAFKDECQRAVDEWESVEFPGMYG